MQRTVEAMLGYFNQIRQVYANELNKKVAQEKFSPNEMSVLILLSNNKTINTASQLKVILGVSKGLVSRSVEALAEKGLVDCRQDERDRRIQRIYLTERAQPLVVRMKSEIEKIESTSDFKPRGIGFVSVSGFDFNSNKLCLISGEDLYSENLTD